MGRADSDNAGGSGNTGGGSSSSGGSSSGGGRSTNSDGRDTPGNPNAADNRRGSTMGKDGGVAPDGGGDSSGSRAAPDSTDSTGSSAAASESQAEAAKTQEEGARTTRSMNSEGLIAGEQASDEAEADKGFLDSVASFFSSSKDGPTTAESVATLKSLMPTMTQEDVRASVLGEEGGTLEAAITSEQETGGFMSAAQAALGFFAGLPGAFVGVAADTAMKAYSAASEIGDLNKTAGMTLDDSYSSALKTQGKGLIASEVGGATVGAMATQIGARSGPAGAIVGAIAGSVATDKMSDTAMRGEQTPSSVNQSTAPADNGNSAMTAQVGAQGVQSAQPVSRQMKPSNFDYGIDASQGFNAYGSYATQFFG